MTFLQRSFPRSFLTRLSFVALLAGAAGAPVSYTHLTLPTIYSV
mgnify:CR=1 FL=1